MNDFWSAKLAEMNQCSAGTTTATADPTGAACAIDPHHRQHAVPGRAFDHEPAPSVSWQRRGREAQGRAT